MGGGSGSGSPGGNRKNNTQNSGSNSQNSSNTTPTFAPIPLQGLGTSSRSLPIGGTSSTSSTRNLHSLAVNGKQLSSNRILPLAGTANSILSSSGGGGERGDREGTGWGSDREGGNTSHNVNTASLHMTVHQLADGLEELSSQQVG